MFFSGHGSPGMCWGVRLRCRYRWTWHCSISPHSCRAEGKQLVISTCNRNSCCNCYYSFIKLEFPMQLCKIPNTFCIRRKLSGPKSFVVKQRVEETFPGIVNILIDMHFFYFKFFFEASFCTEVKVSWNLPLLPFFCSIIFLLWLKNCKAGQASQLGVSPTLTKRVISKLVQTSSRVKTVGKVMNHIPFCKSNSWLFSDCCWFNCKLL